MFSFITIFFIAFILNFLWEEWHSRFYVHYNGKPITHAILVYASSFDAFVTVIGALLFEYVPPFQERLWLVLASLLIFAIGLEIFALRTKRWAYKLARTGGPSMPIIPGLGVGLTPSIQLAFLAYLSYSVAARVVTFLPLYALYK